MIKIRLCQKLQLNLNCVRASSSAAAALFIESLSSARIDSPSTPACKLTHRRHKSNAVAPRLNVEPCEKPRSFDSYFFPQSITPFRFDDVTSHDLQTGRTRIQVLEQWKQLLESLKTIVDGFSCTGTAVQDVSAIRLALERHHIVKLLVRPYSYAAEDVLNSVSRKLSHVVLDLQSLPQGIEIGSLRQNEVTEESVIDTEGVIHSGARSCNKLLDFNQQSCINRLEQESLLAVKVLTTGAWKYPVENAAASCEGIDSTFTRSAEAHLADTSPVTLCRTGENETEGKKPTESKGQRRPNRDQLCAVQDYMADNLPNIFVKFHSYDIYKNDVIFENNWYINKSYVTVYANVKMQLLKITTHDEDGTVRIRWRISGIPQTKAIMFWKFLPWADRSSAADDSEWLDGFSTFFVEDTGLIYKHRMDRVIPDEGVELKKNQTVIEKIATKIATPVATLG